jgi:hypothetical protein
VRDDTRVRDVFGMMKKYGNVGLSWGGIEECGEDEGRKQWGRERG